MVKAPFFDINGLKKGAWSEEEDNLLRAHIIERGHENWRLLPRLVGLARCGKSCRLRWENYLKPGLRRGNFTKHEEDLIIKLHAQLGNKWSVMAKQMPGRTDNDVKNYWHAHISKRGKRNGNVGKLKTSTQIPQTKQSSEFNYGKTTTVDCKAKEVDYESILRRGHSIENPDHIDDFWAKVYQTSCSNVNLPPFAEEEFHDFGLSEEMQINDVPSCSDSSVITDEESKGDFWSELLHEEGTFDMILWQ